LDLATFIKEQLFSNAMIKAIIFDYDGVIVDSFADVYETYKKIFRELGREVPSTISEFRKIYGYRYIGMYESLRFTPEEVRKADLIYVKELLKKNVHIFEGIKKVIEILNKSYTIGMVSASHRMEIEQKLKRFGLFHYFSFIFCKENYDDPLRQKSELLLKAVKRLGLKKEEVVYIGDRNVDYDRATEVGIQVILVDYGWGYDKDKVPEQKVAVKKPLDILKAIKMINS